MSVCVCMCQCVCAHTHTISLKGLNLNIETQNFMLFYMIIAHRSLALHDQGQGHIKHFKIPPPPTIQTVRSYILALAHGQGDEIKTC